ncbi:MAG: ATP phosphoribosyltransferase [Spirochaetales bacterium]|nr:ATP phosphoribosyltransferase [Spirochaetales bacterium]
MKELPLTIALPKGRLQKQVQELFAKKGIAFDFEDRKLVAYDKDKQFKFILVKNSDLPVYLKHGIAGLGVCGSDVVYESGDEFYKLLKFSFGGTTMCLAGMKGCDYSESDRKLTVATKFTKFTEDYYSKLGVPVEIIKLNGSVELAPVLGLAPYIVDLVETGSTLKANNLEIFKKLQEISVYLLANPAYFKIHYKKIEKLVEFLSED